MVLGDHHPRSAYGASIRTLLSQPTEDQSPQLVTGVPLTYVNIIPITRGAACLAGNVTNNCQIIELYEPTQLQPRPTVHEVSGDATLRALLRPDHRCRVTQDTRRLAQRVPLSDSSDRNPC